MIEPSQLKLYNKVCGVYRKWCYRRGLPYTHPSTSSSDIHSMELGILITLSNGHLLAKYLQLSPEVDLFYRIPSLEEPLHSHYRGKSFSISNRNYE